MNELMDGKRNLPTTQVIANGQIREFNRPQQAIDAEIRNDKPPANIYEEEQRTAERLSALKTSGKYESAEQEFFFNHTAAICVLSGIMAGYIISVILNADRFASIAGVIIFTLLAGIGMGNVLSLWTMGHSLETQWRNLKLRFNFIKTLKEQ